MKHFLAFALVLVLAPFLIAQTPAPPPVSVVFTESDREFALKYLNETKDEYVKQLTGISDAQINFRAAEGRWTIAEVAEHITLAESTLFGLITGQVLKSAPPKCEDPFRISDTSLILAITNRSQKFTAPEMLRPASRWKTREELISNFEKARSVTIDYMKNNKADLRAVFMANPFGTIDGYQWFLFLTGHSDRHLAQLKEVKADAKYPKK